MEEEVQSRSGFRDRIDAGRVLAERLGAYRGKDVLVLGIPRGGVPVAAEVARRLDAELDVLVARKLGAPGQPELAIGAVTANGGDFVDEEMVGYLGG
ncbi:MAG TPA: phosphoribosyltransferase family protein, partial [Thermoanaerobaculia bacterium]|nr:phosphoribosyltransferase family protein [Thermoanaerobaculia bacterium]